MEEERNSLVCEYCGATFDDGRKTRWHRLKCEKRPEADKAEETKEAGMETVDEKVELKADGEAVQPMTRKKRIPFGAPNIKLVVEDKDPHHFYRIVNDDGIRVQKAMDAGYVKVEHSVTGKVVGRKESGEPLHIVLMKQPMEFHREDLDAKEAEIKIIDDQIARGEHHKQAGDDRYIPSLGIQYTTNRKA